MSVFCGDRQLSIVYSYKYLGVGLESKLTWTPHMEHLIRRFPQARLERSSLPIQQETQQ